MNHERKPHFQAWPGGVYGSFPSCLPMDVTFCALHWTGISFSVSADKLVIACLAMV